MAKRTLSQIDPASHPLCATKEEALAKTQELQKRMYDLFYLLFAHNRYSLLIILQGIDASGKDGTVRHIFEGANPQGIKVFSFKKPSSEESRHDFLWRCHLHAPERGLTAIFNRSYYEEVTTVQVHPEILHEQGLPDEVIKRKDFFSQRCERINDFEKLLTQQGTLVLKFFLHISKKEQKMRLQNRLQDLSKNWKFSENDLKERKYWNQYMKVFDRMLEATTTAYAPWKVIPADKKWYRDLVISQSIVDALENLKMSFPKLKVKRQRFL